MESVAKVGNVVAVVDDRQALENQGVGLATVGARSGSVFDDGRLVEATTGLNIVLARAEAEVVNEQLAKEIALGRVVVESSVAL